MRKLYKKYTFTIISIAIILVAILGFKLLSSSGEKVETITVQSADYTNVIFVAGKVVAEQSTNLGFDQSGRISAVYQDIGSKVYTGTIIAQIENDALRASVIQKQANLEKEQARLSALERGTRKEQLAVYEQNYTDATSALVIAMRNAHLQTENSILNKVDTIFDNGNSVNPTITVRTQSYTEKRSVEFERLTVGEKLNAWKNSIANITPSSDGQAIINVRKKGSESISATKIFLDRLAVIVNDITPSNSGVSQSVIDRDRLTINTAQQEASAAALSEQSAYSSWNSAYTTLVLERSGSTREDIDAQIASVRAAQADLTQAQALLAKNIIIAPFTGVITKMDAKVGEIVSPNTPLITMMSTGAFEIESFIPEIHISHISIDDTARIQLDAYGSEISFNAKVISVDPAETTRDGVPTYKTRLRFETEDTRIKSGMTANIQITTDQRPNIILIPKKIITDRDGKKFVSIYNQDGSTREIEVKTGINASLGKVEITSGLTSGDKLVVPVTKTP